MPTRAEIEEALRGLSFNQQMALLDGLEKRGIRLDEEDSRPEPSGNVQADLSQGVLAGLNRMGVGAAEMGSRLLSEVKGPGGGSAVHTYDPKLFDIARAEVKAPKGVAGSVGEFVGEAIPSLAALPLAPEGLLGRVAVDATTGALSSEMASPGSGAAGAIGGAGGALLGRAIGGRAAGEAMANSAERNAMMVLNPQGSEQVTEKAARAIPSLMNESEPGVGSLLSANPFRNTTRKVLERARQIRSTRQGQMEGEYTKESARGSRVDVRPVQAELEQAATKTRLPSGELPGGGQTFVRLDDIVDAKGGIDQEAVRALGLSSDNVASLINGSSNGGVDVLRVTVGESVTHEAGLPLQRALAGQSRSLRRSETQLRAAEAARGKQELGDVPAGLRIEDARRLRQQLEPQYKGIIPTTSSAPRREASDLTADSMRRAISDQYPNVGRASELYSRMQNIEDLMDQKLLRQTKGTLSDRYAAIRGLASLIRTASVGAVSLPVAAATVNSSAYRAFNATSRAYLARQIASGNLEAAARIVTRMGELSLQGDGQEQE